MSVERTDGTPPATETPHPIKKAIFAFVVIAIVFSVGYPLPGIHSPYASINSEDVAVIMLAGFFVTKAVSDRDYELNIEFPRTTLLMGLLASWMLLSIGLAAFRTSGSVAVSLLWLLKWFEVLGFFLLAQTLLDRRTGNRVIALLIASGFILALYSVYAVTLGNEAYRIRIFFGNPNTFGVFFVLITVLALSLTVARDGTRRYYFATVTATAVLGVMMTGSRSALLALFVGVSISLMLLRSQVSLKTVIAAGVLTASALLFVVIFLSDSRADRLVAWIEVSNQGIGLAEGNATSGIRQRFKGVKNALELLIQRPVFGHGWYGATTPVGFSDVYFTMLLIELGIPGFVMMIIYHASLAKDWLVGQVATLSVLQKAGLAWYCSLLVQSIGGNFLRTPHIMLLLTLVLTAVHAASREKSHIE